MTQRSYPDLSTLARRKMLEEGLAPDFPPAAQEELETLARASIETLADASARDMRDFLWSSIDNETSQDLDQLEYAEALADGSIRLLIAIADVDAYVRQSSALDRHAFQNTVSVYTPGEVFPMLPEKLSNDLTSLREGADRLAVVVQMSIAADGETHDAEVFRALVRNRAKLVYETAGAWLDGHASAPSKVSALAGLEGQLRLQQEASERLRSLRRRHGALELESIEATPIVSQGRVVELAVKGRTRARDIIENFMIAANTTIAEFLEQRGVPSLRRVVRRPERWPRIVELAESFGERLPEEPDSRALADFLARRKAAAPSAYAELSLSILKLIGSGEYLVEAPGLEQEGHFGLAVGDYTHSTAPNRRYPDLVTQRCLKSAIDGTRAPYTVAELEEIARRCNGMESAARKVERRMQKTATALLLGEHRGETFEAIVTGVKEKGVFVRLLHPPADGMLVEGQRGVDVGDRVRVRLVGTNPERGFIDFARLGAH